jgi:hypothetical protein
MDPTLVLGAITALDRLRDPFDDPTTRPVRAARQIRPVHPRRQASPRGSEAVGRRP